MTARRRQANRLNAKRSTGPKSESGKRSSSRNALKHGLSQLTTLADPTVMELAHLLIEQTDGLALASALEAARCIVEYQRVQRAYQIAYDQLSQPTVKRSERDAGELENASMREGENTHLPSSLSQLARTIDRLGRYERRAFSQRRKAIQALFGPLRETR
jgi:hypothetical protein